MPTFQQNPVDAGLNAAIKTLALANNPAGWDQVKRFDDAPTTLQGVRDYYIKHGRVCIAEEDSDGTIYDCADTNHHLRAWHDSLHLQYGFAFNAAGEAAACYVHIAQVCRRYGVNEKTRKWAALLFGDLLALVHWHQKTGLWPMDKRAFALGGAADWEVEANNFLNVLEADDKINYVADAIERSTLKWGNPLECEV